jgi:hypothetical protein
MTLEEALEIYSKPKERRRGVAKPPLKELGLILKLKDLLLLKMVALECMSLMAKQMQHCAVVTR